MEINNTLAYYNDHAEKFVSDTKAIDFEDKQHILLKNLKPSAHILDLGCGSGRDSKAFIQKGYKVTAIDGSSELCKIASAYIGQQVICKQFKDLHERNLYDAVWACASILHIPSADLPHIISNISNALKAGGYFYASFKHGDFEGERNGRYFTDMTEKSLRSLVGPFFHLEIIEMFLTEDVRSGHEGEQWLNTIIKKKS